MSWALTSTGLNTEAHAFGCPSAVLEIMVAEEEGIC